MKDQSLGHYISFILKIKDGSRMDGTFNGQVIMSDGRKIGLAEGSYIVRARVDSDGGLMRGTICHERSGQRIHFQSGDHVGEFLHNFLVRDRLNLIGEMKEPS